MLLRDAAVATEAKESPLGLTRASDSRCEVKYLYRDGKSQEFYKMQLHSSGDKATEGEKKPKNVLGWSLQA